MRKLYTLLLSLFVAVFFMSTNAMAYSYSKADIPEFSLYFAEPGDTEHSVTSINEVQVDDTFDLEVWISDVPTGKQGLKAFYFDTQYDPQVVTYQGFTALSALPLANNPEPIYGLTSLPEGWEAQGFAGIKLFGPGADGNVPLIQLTFDCEGAVSPNIILTWHWDDDSNFNMFDLVSFYGYPDTAEPGFQGIGDSHPGYAISGTVTVYGDGDAAGIIVMMTGSATGDTVTDQNGQYVFEDLQDGAYTITPKEPVFGFDPGAKTVEIASADGVADFDMYELLGDVNGDSLLNLADTMAGLKILCDVDPDVDVYPEASPNDKIGLPEATNVLQAVADLRPFPPTE